MAASLLCIVLIAFVSIVDSTQTCKIHGLPSRPRYGDVTVLHWTRNTELQLSCRCTVYTPQWLMVKTEDNTSTSIVRPVGCQDHGMPCEGATTFIDPDDGVSPEKFTFLKMNVSVNQTTMLQCYTFNIQDRDSVLILIKDDPTPQPSQTSTTPTAVYSTPALLISVTHTVTQTVCPKPSSSSISEIIARPITSTESHLTSTRGSESHLTSTQWSITPTPTPEVESQPGVVDTVIENIGGTPGLASIATILVLVVIIIALVVTIIVIKIKHNKKLQNRDHVEQTTVSVALDMSDENPAAAVDSRYTLEEYSASPTLPAKRPITHILINQTPSNSSNSSNSDLSLPNTR